MLQQLTHRAAELVARVHRDVKALGILIEWLGKGAVPVSFELANQRADTCSGCPNNKPGTKRIEDSVAEAIRRQDIIRNSASLRTNRDAQLFNCEACGCYLKLKVWVPLSVIPDEPGKFPSTCWIPREREALKVIPETPKPAPEKSRSSWKKIVRIKRESAFGDVIQASILATKLHELGYQVHWRSSDAAITALEHHPHIDHFITDPKAPVDVDLDSSYEENLERRSKSLGTMFLEASDHQLKKIGIRPLPRWNQIPNLKLTDAEIEQMRKRLETIPHPRVACVPKSGFWKSRQIDPEVVNKSAALIKASVIWAFPSPAPSPVFHDIQGPKTFRELMALIWHCDVVFTPDTGPLHVAAAFNKPIVVMEQSIRADLRLTMQSDWTKVGADLKCRPCGEFLCPIDKEKPPCQVVEPQVIADAVNQKIKTLTDETVSAIIPVYKNHPRLDRCIGAAFPQCKEVIVALDGDAQFSADGVKAVSSTGKQLGFGKTCMRGAHESTGGFLLFLNDDCYLYPNAVERMAETMRRDPKCAVVGARLWYPDGTIQHGGTRRNSGDIGFGHRDWKSRTPSLTGEHEMEFVTFACALVRRSAFYSVRGFDEEYHTYCEDSDLCLRLKQAGWKIIYNAHAEAIHDESQTTAPIKSKLHADALQIFERKWRNYFLRTPAPA